MIVDRFQRWRRYRRTVAELSTLTRREMQDLGIAPGDIERIARQGHRD